MRTAAGDDGREEVTGRTVQVLRAPFKSSFCQWDVNIPAGLSKYDKP